MSDEHTRTSAESDPTKAPAAEPNPKPKRTRLPRLKTREDLRTFTRKIIARAEAREIPSQTAVAISSMIRSYERLLPPEEDGISDSQLAAMSPDEIVDQVVEALGLSEVCRILQTRHSVLLRVANG